MKQRLTSDRAVRRFLQIAAIEQTVEKIELSIEEVIKDINDREEHLKELRSQKSELMKNMREAAKDEGQLPLFGDLHEHLIDLGVPASLLPPSASADGAHA